MVRVAAAPGYEVLGEMPWDQGAGTVYFAIERTNGRLVRLRLKEDEHEGLVLTETTGRGIAPFADRLSAAYLADAGTQTHDPPKPAQASVRTRAQAELRERLMRTGALIVVLVAIIIILLVRRRT